MGFLNSLCFLLLVHFTFLAQAVTPACRCIPGDACWPTKQSWQALNSTVNGRLVATELLAEVCHDPYYNETACTLLQAGWSYGQTHFGSSSSFMAPYFQNQTCDPYTPRDRPCVLGNYASYAIDVSSADDVLAGLMFAAKTNVRVTVKNTGHDYLGKSTGRGALDLWTHNLKDISFVDYNSTDYTGPAIEIGAGVQAFEAYAAANKAGLRVIGGECPTIGIAGGYTQGGGHSGISSKYGLAADQALEWEVVTASGQHLIASPAENPDLYWALSGGGGGTYGVVLSLTAKAHSDGIVGGASFAMSMAASTESTFWSAVESFFTSLPAIVDAGGMAMFYLIDSIFSITLTIPDVDNSTFKSLLGPFTSSLGTTMYSLNITSFATYYEHVESYFGPLPYGSIPAAQLTGGRLIPRSVVQNDISTLMSAIKKITALPGFNFAGTAHNVSHGVANNEPDCNAVLPAWRTALLSLAIPAFWNFTAPLEENDAREQTMREVVDLLLKSIGGEGKETGVYMNEADFEQEDWKNAFYGANYRKLLEVKEKYDPQGLFWVRTGVGSDAWVEDGEGRLCRV